MTTLLCKLLFCIYFLMYWSVDRTAEAENIGCPTWTCHMSGFDFVPHGFLVENYMKDEKVLVHSPYQPAGSWKLSHPVDFKNVWFLEKQYEDSFNKFAIPKRPLLSSILSLYFPQLYKFSISVFSLPGRKGVPGSLPLSKRKLSYICVRCNKTNVKHILNSIWS